MTDYIKREDVLNVDVGLMADPNDCSEEQKILSQIIDTAILTFKRYVEKIPAADVVEQKHGKWIEYPECLQYDNAYSDDHIVCSECCHVWSLLDNCTETFNYCPNCGARMDGDS